MNRNKFVDTHTLQLIETATNPQQTQEKCIKYNSFEKIGQIIEKSE